MPKANSMSPWTACPAKAPTWALVHVVPVHANLPTIDGRMVADEWQGALVLPMTQGDDHARVHLVSNGERLFLVGEAPADTTATGYDQFRFWFHLHLSPALPYERAFLSGSGGDVNVMRSVAFP